MNNENYNELIKTLTRKAHYLLDEILRVLVNQTDAYRNNINDYQFDRQSKLDKLELRKTYIAINQICDIAKQDYTCISYTDIVQMIKEQTT